MKITFSVLGRLLGAVLVLAFYPSVTHAQFVGPTAITINGTFTDWTGNVYSQTDGSNAGANVGSANDITQFWSAMSTANGTSPASTSNLIQNVYYRFDTGNPYANNPKQSYWVQLNLGTAAPGLADHILQFFVNTSPQKGDPIVSIVLYSYNTPYPGMGAFTDGTITPRVSNLSSGYGVYDSNATGSYAINGTYSLEVKIPIGWFSSTYGGSITADGTGASMIASAMFTSSGGIGSVSTVKDVLDDASGNTFYSQQSATIGSVSFVAGYSGGNAYSAAAAAATLTPVAGAADTITLTVQKNNGGAVSTDTTYTGAHNVTISGYSAAPNGSYGSFSNVTLTTLSQTNSVIFTAGVATVPLILNKAATQIIGFSLPDLTYPAANNLTITPTAGTASKLAFTNSPVTMTAGVASGNITVQRQDHYGNPVMAEGTRTVTLSSNSTGTKTFIPASLSIATNTSSASFTYTDTKAGTPTITAASTSPSTITPATQQETVNAAAASQLVVTTQPSASTVAGVAFATQPVVTIEDAFGNVLTSGSDSTVSVALTLTTGTGSLGGTASMAAVNGVADFTGKGLNINLVGTDKVLTATATVVAGTKTTTTSPAFTITFAAASKLVVTTQPSASTVAGVAFAQQPVVKIEDAFGNVVTSGADATRVVTVALTTGSGTLSGTLTKTAAAGVADFSGQNLSINLVGTDKVLTMSATITAGARTTTTSPAFTITAGALDHFAISTILSPQTAGTAITGITLTAQDVNSNTVTSFVSTVAYSGTAGITGTSASFTSGVLSGVSVTPTVAGSGLTFIVTGSSKTGTATITTVNKGSTSVVVASSGNPSGYKDSVTFTATLPAATTGSVVFLTNGAAFGSAVTLSSGSATSLSLTNLPRGTNAITAQYAGDGNYLGSTNNLSGGQVVTNHPPVAGVTTIYRTAGLRLKIAWSDVTTNWSDSPDGDPVTLTSMSLVTTNLINLTTNSTYILYTNSPNVNDQITYTINDGQGRTNPGVINVVITPFVTGQLTGSITVSGGLATAGFAGIPGYTYGVQRSTNLPVWKTIWTTNAPGGGLFQYTDNFSDLGVVPASAFYRLSWAP